MKKAKGFLWLEVAFILPILFLFIAALVELRTDGLNRFIWSKNQLKNLASESRDQANDCHQGPDSRIFPENQRVYWRFSRASPGGQLGFDCPKNKTPSSSPQNH